MALRSVSVPCLAGDVEAFGRLLDVWSDPRFAPRRAPADAEPVTLLVVLNRARPGSEEAFAEAFRRRGALRAAFSQLVVRDAGLEGDRDLYVRDSLGAAGAFGNKAGPNFLFFETMRAAGGLGGFTFQNELDCFPLGRGWLDDLGRLAAEHPRAWVVGSCYTGEVPLSRALQSHLNGNALYQVGDPAFQRFLSEAWEPRLLELVRTDPNLAYDCWWAVERSRASSARRNLSWELVRAFDGRFCASPFLINLLFAETLAADMALAAEVEADAEQAALLVHGRPAVAVYEALLASPEADARTLLSAPPGGAGAPAGDAEGEDEGLSAHEVAALRAQAPALGSPAADEGATVGLLLQRQVVPPDGVLRAEQLGRDGLLGTWHDRAADEPLWMGPGEAALLLALPRPARRVEVRIQGRRGSDDPDARVDVAIHGGAEVVGGPLSPDGSFEATVTAPSPLSDLTVIFTSERHGMAPGDSRPLAFAFFLARVQPA